MRHSTLLWGILALSVTAHGEIRLFWSTTGLANTSLRYSTALTNFLPIVSATPVAELAPGTYDLYLWGQFIEGWDLHAWIWVYGVDLAFAGDATYAENVAYRQNKTGAGAYRRWDGSLGIALDGLMWATTSRGIEFNLPPVTNSYLYFPESAQFLLGAVRVTGAAGQNFTMTRTGPGFWYWDPDVFDPPAYPTFSPAVLLFTPEPAGGLLVLLAVQRFPLRRLQARTGVAA